MNAREKFQLDDGTGCTDARKYRSIVEGLLYLVRTRLDISFAVGIISRFMSSPTKQHMGAAKGF